MPNLLRPLHRILVVAVCLMFGGALAVPLAADGDLAQGRAGAPQFVCNQVTAMTLTREWYRLDSSRPRASLTTAGS